MSFRAALLWVFVLVCGWMFVPWLVGSTGPFGKLTESKVSGSAPYPVLSPDGKTVAMVHDYSKMPGAYAQVVTTTVEVRESRSSRLLGTFSLPSTMTGTATEEGWGNDFTAQYCDHGKYIVLSDTQNLIYVVDATTFRTHNTFDVRLMGDTAELAASHPRISYVLGGCAANGTVAVLHLFGGRFGEAGKIRLVDIETGETLKGIENLDTSDAESVVISPSGDMIAFLQHENDVSHSGAGELKVFRLRENAFDSQIAVGHLDLRPENGLAFAGDSSIVLNQRVINGDFKEHWAFRLVDLHTGNIAGPLGDEGTYKVAVSVDGKTVMAYRPRESFSGSSRFTLSDRETGNRIVESPALKSTYHGCFPNIGMGSCTPSYGIPTLQLSQDGRSVLAWWKDEPPRVFSLR